MLDVVDRLETATRSFERAVFVGALGLEELLTPGCGVGEIISVEPVGQPHAGGTRAGGGLGFAADEERWPVAPASLDLIVSLLTLHGANDLVGALAQARASLKPDGLFVAALFAENTLRELREALYAAETTLTGGVAPRVAPFATVRDLGAALQRAGFAMPVVDLDAVAVDYHDPTRLISDLRDMGETNALARRQAFADRRIAAEALNTIAAAGGRVTFDIAYLTAWSPDPGQPKPLPPGSARHSLADAVRDV